MRADYVLRSHFLVATIKGVSGFFGQPYYNTYERISEILERNDSNHAQICAIQSKKAFSLKKSLTFKINS